MTTGSDPEWWLEWEANEDLLWRFLTKVEKTDSCWLWRASLRKDGYGNFSIDGKIGLAHRAAWRLLRGDIGANCVLHRCDVRACVNPDHLFLGSIADNVADMIAKGRRVKRQVHPESVIERVRALKTAGLTVRKISAATGVSPSQVSKVTRFKQRNGVTL